jgi:UDP-2,3-diacylglucosamine hydrolase
VDSRVFLKPVLAPKGVLTRRKPNEAEKKDIALGFKAAKHIGRLDAGQTIVVKDGTIVSVEALEGTDQAIRRAGALAGAGCVVVKAAKPNQSLRFDLPCVGRETLESMCAVSAGVLALEAGKTLVLSKESFLDAADKLSICVIGL